MLRAVFNDSPCVDILPFCDCQKVSSRNSVKEKTFGDSFIQVFPCVKWMKLTLSYLMINEDRSLNWEREPSPVYAAGNVDFQHTQLDLILAGESRFPPLNKSSRDMEAASYVTFVSPTPRFVVQHPTEFCQLLMRYDTLFHPEGKQSSDNFFLLFHGPQM